MRNLEELKGAFANMQRCYASPEVKAVLAELKKIANEKLEQDLLNRGEEAVRALGFQQGIGVVNILPDILESSIKAKESTDRAALEKKLHI